jgi:hypothetical protein
MVRGKEREKRSHLRRGYGGQGKRRKGERERRGIRFPIAIGTVISNR